MDSMKSKISKTETMPLASPLSFSLKNKSNVTLCKLKAACLSTYFPEMTSGAA